MIGTCAAGGLWKCGVIMFSAEIGFELALLIRGTELWELFGVGEGRLGFELESETN